MNRGIEARASTLVSVALCGALAAPLGAIDLILRTGTDAPGLPGLIVAGFSSTPTTSEEGYVVLHVTVSGAGVTVANDGVIYRWHRTGGFDVVARESDTVDFNGGTRTLDILGTPIVDDRGWVAFTSTLVGGGTGMVLWEPPSTLHPVAVTGETLGIDCQTTTGAPCGTPIVTGPLLNISSFGTRRNAILRTYEDGEIHYHEILFVGPIDNNTFGDPESLWRSIWTETGGESAEADSVAGELEIADGTENANYFVGFTDLAACSERFGLFDIQDAATDTVYQIDESGASHTLLDRYYPVDIVNRNDLHCHGGNYSYAGSRGTEPNDHDQTKRGVFINTTQVYEATVTSAEIGGGHTIGAPFGQAITRDDPPKSVFSANMIGTTYNGKGGVWRRGTSGGLSDLLLYESQPLAQPPADVQTIYSAHAGGTGAVAFHVLMSNGNQALLGKAKDSIFGEVFKISTRGDTVPNGSGGTLTVDFFSVLGGLPADPVVLGGGGDGQLSALNGRGEFVFLVFFQSGGSGLYHHNVDPGLFSDDFESEDYCAWSAVSGAPAC